MPSVEDPRRARILALLGELLDTLLIPVPAEPAPKAASAPVPSPLVDKREIARLLGVSVATVDRHDREGQPHIYIGDVKRYDASAVMAWHRERSAPAAPPALSSFTGGPETMLS
jgi:hypothetical protein